MSDFEKINEMYEKNQDNNEILEWLLLLFNQQKYIDCIKSCNYLIEKEIDVFSVYTLLGYSLFSIEKYDDAMVAIEKAIILDKNNSLNYYVRGKIYYSLAKYSKAIEDFDQAIKLEPKKAEYYLNRGETYKLLKNYEKAISDYNNVVELDSNNIQAYYNRAYAYKKLYNFDKAVEDYTSVIYLDENYIKAYNNRGNSYRRLKDYDNALKDFDKAINFDKSNAIYYNNRGLLYRDIENFNNAFKDFDKAINLNPNYIKAYNNRGNLYKETKDYNKALEDYKKAKKLSKGDFSAIKTIEDKIQQINGIISNIDNESKKINLLMEKINNSSIEKNIRIAKESFEIFLSEKEVMEKQFEFSVLRRWNSYTPILSQGNLSKGGGYFIRMPNCGIVIDPGFNFIDNFQKSGHYFYEIDHIFISHAHNDHTCDLESILTLLHQYNDKIMGSASSPEPNTIMSEATNKVMSENKSLTTEEAEEKIEKLAKDLLLKSPRRKRIFLYMSSSTYTKYAPMLSLYKNSAHEVIIIKAGETLSISNPKPFSKDETDNICITAIYAKHDDMFSDKDSLGFIFNYNSKFNLIYTGDTGFDEEIEEKYKEIRKEYRNQKVMLLAHIGGFKEHELKYKSTFSKQKNSNYFYKNHLGRLGLAKLIEILLPDICIISEFGEEFRESRKELTNIFNEVYGDTTFFIPADIGLCFNEKYEIKLIEFFDISANLMTSNYYSYKLAEVCERDNDYSLHYYKKDIANSSKLSAFLTTKYFNEN